jgi:ABC-type sugar transport system ATPase subunit
MFAKWLFHTPRVFIADEPTRGVDVGTKLTIYKLIQSLAGRGIAVLLISTEHQELVGLAHRVLVMRNGRIAEEFDRRTLTEEALLHAVMSPPAAGVSA